MNPPIEIKRERNSIAMPIRRAYSETWIPRTTGDVQWTLLFSE
jgi:hypothetical protein